jgi:hypothetical protein
MTKTGPVGTWLAIAFLRGDDRLFKDRLITAVTTGPFVHTEVLIGRDGESLRQARAYASFEGVSGFTPSRSFHKQTGCSTLGTNKDDSWEVIKYPLPAGGYERACAAMLQILAADLPYNHRDLWQCFIPVCLPFENDLDCERPETWKASGGTFCSQAALLILRRLSRLHVVSLSCQIIPRVEHTNSRGCSPNDLFRMLTQAPHGQNDEKKT